MKKKILITDGVHQVLLKQLKNAGFTVDYRPKLSLEQVREIVAPYHGIVINSKIIVDEAFLTRAPNLEFVARLGSGMEIIDQNATDRRHISVFNSPNGNCNAVAEHAMGMILMWHNNLYQANNEVKSMIWRREENRGTEIIGKNLGIIGFGHTGSALAQKLEGFGVSVYAYDKYKKGYATGTSYINECTSLDEVLKKADILSFHLPLNFETVKLANKSLFYKTKRGVLIVNTSRGGVIDTPDLMEAILSGQVAGACLDVFENEKPETYSPEEKNMYQTLFAMPSVLTSPHIAGWTKESKFKLADILLHKILTHYGIDIEGSKSLR